MKANLSWRAEASPFPEGWALLVAKVGDGCAEIVLDGAIAGMAERNLAEVFLMMAGDIVIALSSRMLVWDVDPVEAVDDQQHAERAGLAAAVAG
jgi:hypothetical protein